MKKKIFMLLVCGTVLLTGCNKNYVTNDNKIGQDSNITQSYAIEENTNLKIDSETSANTENTTRIKETDSDIEYAEEIRNKYAAILSDEKYILEISDKIKKDDKFIRIPIQPKKNNTNFLHNNILDEIIFSLDEEGVSSKNFWVFFLSDTDNAVIKEFIKVTLMALDSSINEDLADEKVREMVGSTADSIRSEIVDAGEYHVFYEKKSGNITVNAIHDSEINVKVNKEEYQNYSVEEMRASLNKGEKAYITVTPYTYKYSTGVLDQFMAKSDEGDEYLVYYNFNEFLMDFELGKKYTLYGWIAPAQGNTPCFGAIYYEEE